MKFRRAVLVAVMAMAVPAQAQVLDNWDPGHFFPLWHIDLHGASAVDGSVLGGVGITLLDFGPVQTLGVGAALRASVGNPKDDPRFGFAVTFPLANFSFATLGDSLFGVGVNGFYDGGRKDWGISAGVALTRFPF